MGSPESFCGVTGLMHLDSLQTQPAPLLVVQSRLLLHESLDPQPVPVEYSATATTAQTAETANILITFMFGSPLSFGSSVPDEQCIAAGSPLHPGMGTKGR